MFIASVLSHSTSIPFVDAFEDLLDKSLLSNPRNSKPRPKLCLFFKEQERTHIGDAKEAYVNQNAGLTFYSQD